MAVRAHGVETVYQDLALFDNLDPAANFFAGRELAGPSWLPKALRFMRHRRMAERTAELLDRLQVKLPDLDAAVALMSGGYDLSVTLTGRSFRDVAMFVAKRLSPLDGVLSTATHFVLKKYKERGVLFTDEEKDERGGV
jgi:ABC-type uncharacterized transport system ATPase subunit